MDPDTAAGCAKTPPATNGLSIAPVQQHRMDAGAISDPGSAIIGSKNRTNANELVDRQVVG
jgi:hypothetical protein